MEIFANLYVFLQKKAAEKQYFNFMCVYIQTGSI